jgi:taspase (threonine aspartase 1)
VVAHEVLVSRNARDRYMRWREDLKRAEGRMTPSSSTRGSQVEDDDQLKIMYEEQLRAKQRRDHTNAIMSGTWNEGQPDSPSPQVSPGLDAFGQDASTRGRSPSPAREQYLNPRVHQLSPTGPSSSKRPRYSRQASDDRRLHSLLSPNSGIKSPADVVVTGSKTLMSDHRPGSSDGHMSPREALDVAEEVSGSSAFFQEGTAESPSKPFDADDDNITDTVGAIAIDMYGQIAAGSSSGGIGMKHRGRVGPAALVGVGSAVIPTDMKDQDGIAVAAVTSGTGEHMATTMASQKCAERLYRNTRRAPGGGDIEATEEEAIQAFVQNDFMEHPGVVNSNSVGAIGVMAVKKTSWGYFLHFAHNTDSFALASMSSTEKDAKCVMSRLGDTGACVRGARKIRIE